MSGHRDQQSHTLVGGAATTGQNWHGGTAFVSVTAGDGTSGAGGFDGSTATLQSSVDGGTTYIAAKIGTTAAEWAVNGTGPVVLGPCLVRFSCSAGTIVDGVGILRPTANVLLL